MLEERLAATELRAIIEHGYLGNGCAWAFDVSYLFASVKTFMSSACSSTWHRLILRLDFLRS